MELVRKGCVFLISIKTLVLLSLIMQVSVKKVEQMENIIQEHKGSLGAQGDRPTCHAPTVSIF